MTDYVQCGRNNCGAVATLFSLFGSAPVPDTHLPLLQNDSWSAASISTQINRIGGRLRPRISSTWHGPTFHVTTRTNPTGCTLQELLRDQFVARGRARASRSSARTDAEVIRVASAVLLEIIGELLVARNPQCVIISGIARGYHWQTYYRTGSTTAVHNGRTGWIPELFQGMGPGVVFVSGPRM